MWRYLSKQPFQKVTVDVLGPFAVTDSLKKILAMDCIWKWLEVVVLSNQKIETVAELETGWKGMEVEVYFNQRWNVESELWSAVNVGNKKTDNTITSPVKRKRQIDTVIYFGISKFRIWIYYVIFAWVITREQPPNVRFIELHC